MPKNYVLLANFYFLDRKVCYRFGRDRLWRVECFEAGYGGFKRGKTSPPLSQCLLRAGSGPTCPRRYAESVAQASAPDERLRCVTLEAAGRKHHDHLHCTV
jgi:hypothetical protein